LAAKPSRGPAKGRGATTKDSSKGRGATTKGSSKLNVWSIVVLCVALAIIGFTIWKYFSSSPGSDITTGSGLKYVDEVVGTGESPSPGKYVKVHYTGRLENGTKFDSSVDRGQPFEFPIGVGRVIKGWDEGVMTMKVGGKRKLIIPPDLGYGAFGAGDRIPPNSTLIFEVELLGVR
jgi:FKBP-type peptidyl-prolyl cis-trans isomerase FkpA